MQKSRHAHELSTPLKRKLSFDQTPVQNKRGRPSNDSLSHRNYSKQQTSSIRTQEVSAFDRGLEAEKILGATDATVRRKIKAIINFFLRNLLLFRVS